MKKLLYIQDTIVSSGKQVPFWKQSMIQITCMKRRFEIILYPYQGMEKQELQVEEPRV